MSRSVRSFVKQRAYTQSLRAQRTAETRARIIDAAREVVLEGKDFTIADVAARAGVARATVFKQIASKRALLIAVEADAAERAGVMELLEEVARADGPRALRAALVGGTRIWHRERAIFRRFYRDHDLADFVRAKERQRRAVALLIANKLASRLVVDVETAADSIWLLSSFASYEKLAERRLTTKQIAAVLLRLASALVRR